MDDKATHSLLQYQAENLHTDTYDSPALEPAAMAVQHSYEGCTTKLPTQASCYAPATAQLPEGALYPTCLFHYTQLLPKRLPGMELTRLVRPA